VRIQLGTSANNAANYCLVYNYYSGSKPASCAVPAQGTGNNGNVRGYWYHDNVNSTLSHTAAYGYDSLNRLISHKRCIVCETGPLLHLAEGCVRDLVASG
jgi:hypothetical protein